MSIQGIHGEEVARGLVNYDSPDVLAILGRQTDEIESLLGERDFDEVVHRDNLVVL